MNVASTTCPTAAAAGSEVPESLEAAFMRFQAELLGTLYYLVGNQEDARDALQETFIKCWRHRDAVPGVENLKAWIFKIALNTGRDIRSTAWRRRRQALPSDDSLTAGNGAPASAAVERAEQLDHLRIAILDLRPEDQEVFLLRQNGEMTYEQIAHAVGIPTGTVKTRMRLALGKLRVALEAT